MCLNFVGERTQKCDKENREWRQRQIGRLYLDLVVKKLCYINCLNAWATNCATFRNQKLCCLSTYYIKMMKRRTLQACNFKTQHQKRHVFCLGQTGLVSVGQGGSPPPSPRPPLATRLLTITAFQGKYAVFLVIFLGQTCHIDITNVILNNIPATQKKYNTNVMSFPICILLD